MLSKTVPNQTKPNQKKARRVTVPKRTHELWLSGDNAVVAGVDEVGRGAWAGPVAAAAVVLDPGYRLRKVKDSKLLSAADRQAMVERIYAKSRAVGVGVVELCELNHYGLSWAVKHSGLRALEALNVTPDHVLLDGHWNPYDGAYECTTIVKGDASELCIAAASVIAKVYRDRLMEGLERQHPGYGFAAHKGYGTPEHQAALKEHGICGAHRTRWSPVIETMQATL